MFDRNKSRIRSKMGRGREESKMLISLKGFNECASGRLTVPSSTCIGIIYSYNYLKRTHKHALVLLASGIIPCAPRLHIRIHRIGCVKNLLAAVHKLCAVEGFKCYPK